MCISKIASFRREPLRSGQGVPTVEGGHSFRTLGQRFET